MQVHMVVNLFVYFHDSYVFVEYAFYSWHLLVKAWPFLMFCHHCTYIAVLYSAKLAVFDKQMYSFVRW